MRKSVETTCHEVWKFKIWKLGSFEETSLCFRRTYYFNIGSKNWFFLIVLQIHENEETSHQITEDFTAEDPFLMFELFLHSEMESEMSHLTRNQDLLRNDRLIIFTSLRALGVGVDYFQAFLCCNAWVWASGSCSLKCCWPGTLRHGKSALEDSHRLTWPINQEDHPSLQSVFPENNAALLK